jgi:hypothetical protein
MKAEEQLAALVAGVLKAAPGEGNEDAPLEDAPPRELRSREQQALDALRSAYGEGGATATQWQTATGMSEATFLRARKELIQRGLVIRDGDARRGARYVVRDPSVSANGHEA